MLLFEVTLLWPKYLVGRFHSSFLNHFAMNVSKTLITAKIIWILKQTLLWD